ncbi:MAG: peptidylprolyl isomerase [Methanosarcinales archaeon]|nr:MAG: peptidylprolyl isomerase [Methanosarcinales archaeon]
MVIQDRDFIRISYTGRFEDGTVFDTTDEETAKENDLYDENARYEPFVIVVGSKHVAEGLDEDLIGKDAGYHGTVEVPPTKGYGEREAELITTHSISGFKEKPVAGARVRIDGKEGVVTMTIGRKVRVDFNHPMAGKTLIFDYNIEDVLDDDTTKTKALLRSYFVVDFDVEVTDDIVRIESPRNLLFNERWIIMKEKLARELLQSIDIDSVKFVETYSES